jgi:hypothetical protein
VQGKQPIQDSRKQRREIDERASHATADSQPSEALSFGSFQDFQDPPPPSSAAVAAPAPVHPAWDVPSPVSDSQNAADLVKVTPGEGGHAESFGVGSQSSVSLLDGDLDTSGLPLEVSGFDPRPGTLSGTAPAIDECSESGQKSQAVFAAGRAEVVREGVLDTSSVDSRLQEELSNFQISYSSCDLNKPMAASRGSETNA